MPEFAPPPLWHPQVPFKPTKERVRQLLHEMVMTSMRVIFKPLLTVAHRKKRVDFAKAHRCYTVDQWKKVVFSDEKTFRLRPGGAIHRWLPKSANSFEAAYVTQVVQRPEGLMVWAAINGRGEICLKRCPRVMTAHDYQNILEASLGFIKTRYRKHPHPTCPSSLLSQVRSTTISAGRRSHTHSQEHQKLAIAKEGEDV